MQIYSYTGSGQRHSSSAIIAHNGRTSCGSENEAIELEKISLVCINGPIITRPMPPALLGYG